jgi:hypothetical protein
VEGERVASIILICPNCRHKRPELADRKFLHNLSPHVSDPAY